MKKINLILLFITSAILSIQAQFTDASQSNKICDFGITFEISSNPGWGYGEPVVLTVQPFSEAEKAGIKVGDVIMEVNGTATYLRNYLTISNWLQDSRNPEIRLTIRNIDTYFKEYTIQRQCRDVNSMSEYSLATAYSFYSLENTSQRAFTLPLRVDPNLNADFSDYHTFDFIDEGTNVPEMDFYINDQIEKALLSRGLRRDRNDPDLIVQTYYTYQPNVKYDVTTNSRNTKTWRYDTYAKGMVQVPILSAEDPNAELKGQFVLELGVRIFDKKYIDENNLTQIWDCKAREFLTDQMSLEEYTKMHASLILMQFPYSSPKTNAKYVVEFKTFNYTGMNFDMKDLQTITDVDASSPAYQAGIRRGDVVEKINGISFNYSVEELDNGYRRFLIETMPLRDRRTRFIDANGFPDCMYWERSKYQEVAAAFRKEAIYTPSFSYLYAFEPYVSGAPTSSISINLLTRNGERRTVNIAPQIQRSIVVRAL